MRFGSSKVPSRESSTTLLEALKVLPQPFEVVTYSSGNRRFLLSNTGMMGFLGPLWTMMTISGSAVKRDWETGSGERQ